MSTNLHKRLLALIPAARRLYGQVQSVDPVTGAVVVELPGGATMRVTGESSIGEAVWIRDGVIEGPAPVLSSVVQIEV